MKEKTLTIEEVAERLQLSYFNVLRKAQTGELPFTKIGNLWRMREEDFDRLFGDRKTQTQTKEEAEYE